MKDEKTCKQLMIYKCGVCGNVMVKLVDSGITPTCCGRDMEHLVPGKEDASTEKHVPVWMMDGCKVIVEVGSDPHPQTGDHRIEWIILKTDKGFYAKEVSGDDNARACFKLCKDENVECVYSYCNLHKLWQATTTGKQYECPLCGI